MFDFEFYDLILPEKNFNYFDKKFNLKNKFSTFYHISLHYGAHYHVIISVADFNKFFTLVNSRLFICSPIYFMSVYENYLYKDSFGIVKDCEFYTYLNNQFFDSKSILKRVAYEKKL